MKSSINKLTAMNKINNTRYLFVLLILLSFFISACRIDKNENDSTQWKEEIDLKGEWKFSIGDDENWSKTSASDKDWEKIKVPSPWENEGFHGYNGYAWYRKHFVISSGLKSKGLYLNLGVIDDVDEVYVNGKLVGTTGSFPPNYQSAYYNQRNYPLPSNYLNFGSDNLIAVRVYDNELEGGIISGNIGIYSMKDYLLPDIPLEGTWKLNKGDTLAWKEQSIVDSDWKSVVVPGFWESQGFQDYDGFAWYRKSFFVPKNLAGKKLIFSAGKIDDFDQVYINGKLIGIHGSFRDPDNMITDQNTWREFRGYTIPDNILKPGSNNTVAIRVYDGGLGGGIYEGPIGIITQERYTKFWRDKRE